MARNIDPDRSADCHASGSVPTAAFLVKAGREITVCGHHLAKSVTRLVDTGWEIIPVKRVAGTGVGTEATGQHYSMEAGA